jgi:PD-(D/E)XK nuclease superfamily protein
MMKQRIQISAKNLGALALPAFCPKCFWVRMKCGDKLPFQIFPGIFSSIDSYSKKVTTAHFRRHGRAPRWFDGFGELGHPIAVPGWSKFQMLDQETNVLLTGVPDEILRHPERGIWIGDYKTARCTGNQDALAPMYEVQLNCYAMIASKIGLGAVYGLGLLYYEPVTDLEPGDPTALIRDDGFFLNFSPKLKSVELDPNMILPLLRKVREICATAECPAGKPGCSDCSRLELLTSAANRANP